MVAFTLLAGPSEATTVTRLGLAELTNNASSILVGTCEQAEVVSSGGRIYSKYQFPVNEIVKGENPLQPLVEISLPGGRLEERIQHISGMPDFTTSAETVLFLTGPNASGHVWPVGLSQGTAIRAEAMPGSTAGYRESNLSGTMDGAGTAKGTAKTLAPDPLGGMDLEDFL